MTHLTTTLAVGSLQLRDSLIFFFFLISSSNSTLLAYIALNHKFLKNAKICITPDPKPKICVTPNTNPQRKSVEHRLCWVPNAKFSHWPCRFQVVYLLYFRVGYPTRTLFSVEYGLYKIVIDCILSSSCFLHFS